MACRDQICDYCTDYITTQTCGNVKLLYFQIIIKTIDDILKDGQFCTKPLNQTSSGQYVLVWQKLVVAMDGVKKNETFEQLNSCIDRNSILYRIKCRFIIKLLFTVKK